MHFYTLFSSLVYLISTAGLKQDVLVFLKKTTLFNLDSAFFISDIV